MGRSHVDDPPEFPDKPWPGPEGPEIPQEALNIGDPIAIQAFEVIVGTPRTRSPEQVANEIARRVRGLKKEKEKKNKKKKDKSKKKERS